MLSMTDRQLSSGMCGQNIMLTKGDKKKKKKKLNETLSAIQSASPKDI